MVARPRLLVTVLRVCVEAVILCGGLTLALGLSMRVTTAAAILLVGCFVGARGFVLSTVAVTVHSCLPTPVRLTVVPGLSEVWV